MWFRNLQRGQPGLHSGRRAAHGRDRPPDPPLQGGATEAAYRAYLGALTAALQSLEAADADKPFSSIQDAGIRAGEVRAWRCWRYEHGELFSMARENKWIPGVPMTGNVGFSRVDGIGFGVHAWKSRHDAERYARSYPDRCLVIGQVDLWGELVEHEKGYRARYAAIVSLDKISGPWLMRDARLRRVRKRHNDWQIGNHER